MVYGKEHGAKAKSQRSNPLLLAPGPWPPLLENHCTSVIVGERLRGVKLIGFRITAQN